MKLQKIILSSHGTSGARVAEEAALALCVESGASLRQLFVVPDFWKGMMGDDWLNNAVTQARFGRYVESQLAREAANVIRRLGEKAEDAGVSCSDVLRLGKPAPCLVTACQGDTYDLAVIGSPRPKGSPGLRSRMDLEFLARSLPTRLLIVPHPER